MKLNVFLNDFAHIFLPRICACCDSSLLSDEELLCTDCLYHLPLTDFHRDDDNNTARQLWGKLAFERAVSMLYLARSSRVEHLMYKLKYGNEPEIGRFLGRYYANILSVSGFLDSIEIILPVPIHKSKLRKRGYNQSAQFAMGLSEACGVPWSDTILMRTKATVSQTQKSRLERYDNVEGVFALKANVQLKDRHVLIVDDVMTTGATICEAGKILLDNGAKVSVATISRA